MSLESEFIDVDYFAGEDAFQDGAVNDVQSFVTVDVNFSSPNEIYSTSDLNYVNVDEFYIESVDHSSPHQVLTSINSTFHEIVKTDAYTCHECERSFSRRADLYSHVEYCIACALCDAAKHLSATEDVFEPPPVLLPMVSLNTTYLDDCINTDDFCDTLNPSYSGFSSLLQVNDDISNKEDGSCLPGYQEVFNKDLFTASGQYIGQFIIQQPVEWIPFANVAKSSARTAKKRAASPPVVIKLDPETSVSPFPTSLDNISCEIMTAIDAVNLRPSTKMRCPICNLLLNRHNYTVHFRIHTGELPYQCDYCDRRFRTTSSKKVHTRKHTGQKPYKCTNCSYATVTKRNLDRHIFNIHKKDCINVKT